MNPPYATHRLHRSQAHHTCVLVVTQLAEHVVTLRALTAGRRHRLHIEWARDDRTAIDLALKLHPQLVLIDARLSGDRAPLLRRYLTSGLREAAIFLCQPVLCNEHDDTVHWDEAPMLLRHWEPPVHLARSHPTGSGVTA
jgi:hypothetical protein